MSRLPSGERATGAGLRVSSDPDAWSREYRELAGRIRSRYASALDRRAPVPPILEIHPGPACPASCRFCPTRGAKLYPLERRREVLGAEELRILVKDFAVLGGETLVLSGGLEPLSGPAVAAAVAGAEAGLEVQLYTSGLSAVLDDPAERRALLRSASQIRFSVNGMRGASYGEVQLAGRPGERQLARVRARIEALVADRAVLGASSSIGLSFVAVESSAAEVFEALEYCERLGLDFLDVLVDISDDREPPAPLAAALEALRRRAEAGAGRGPRIRVSGRTGTAPVRARRCAAPRVKVAIDPFGYAWRCCYVANPELASADLLLGDVRERGLRAVLTSEALEPIETRCSTCLDFERTVNVLVEAREETSSFSTKTGGVPERFGDRAHGKG